MGASSARLLLQFRGHLPRPREPQALLLGEGREELGHNLTICKAVQRLRRQAVAVACLQMLHLFLGRLVLRRRPHALLLEMVVVVGG